ncbi:MAG TPA: hypothetical protein VGY75_05850 [Candidatus Udaeobacter sp.]|jgi:hypothetical protein|nr:hypothetical protein [Candidatus Udaeobacter sp.]
MRGRWRELFTSKLNKTAPWDRWDFVALALGMLTAVWVFALKLKTFYDLGYSGDIFVITQLARSWLEGRGLLQDNCFGNYLNIHTYFLLLPLGLIAKPFGAPGLLFVLAAAVGAVYFWAARILRLLGVDGRVTVIAAAMLLISPLSVAFYQEAGNGFYVETLALPLCLILFYFLLRQRVIPSIVTAIAVISVKEDAPVAAAMVAIVAAVETWISSPGKPAPYRFNWPAAITLVLSVCAIPVLLAISSAQSPTAYAHHSLDRLGIVAPGTLSNPRALFAFVGSNIAHWLGSNVVRQWLWVMIVGTFGTVLLRPYYLVVGVPTTVVAWLMNRNDLLWAPRFFSTEALVWCITLLGFASIARAVPPSSKWMRATVLTAAIIITLTASAQLALVPWFARGAYLLRSTRLCSSSEREQADAVFVRYCREAKPEEPVIASTTLFRYAHDRNLFWLTRLHGRPTPIWILGDSADAYAPLRITTDRINAESGIHLEDYVLLDRRGRFALFRKRE